jgi:spore photoproduct lyase
LHQQHRFVRIGTGELTDSLAYDSKTGYSRKLLKIFASFPNMIFEFKTKSTAIGNLLSAKPPLPNIVVSWSLNPQFLIRREESKTPSLRRRLKALSAVQAKGYRIGVHLDPLLVTRGYRTLYRDLIRELAGVIRPDRVAWWSLGALRFPSALRPKIFEHSNSRLFEGELVRGYDDKYRYFTPQRLELFAAVRDEIYRQISRHLPLYLCMEDRSTWEEIFPGISPDSQTINRMLYESVLN